MPADPTRTRPTRRTFLMAAAATVAAAPRPGRAADAPPVSGDAVPVLAGFDELMTGFVRDRKIPGAALAVAHRGRLVYARGFGLADPAAGSPVRPDALFRIASVSKPVTAAAVFRLADQGKFKLDDPVLPLTGLRDPAPKDPRWDKVTVRHCLSHTGGWDRAKSFDPIGRAWQIAKEFGIDPPVGPERVIRYMLARSLDFDPGERQAYSNLGYLLLGRVVAAVSGKGYEEYVKAEVLAPLGVTRARLGRARVENRAEGEVKYVDRYGKTGPCLYPPAVGEAVPRPDGADNFEAYEAHGGWIASAPDLVRFAAAFADPEKCPLMSARMAREMVARPPGIAGDSFYAAGWKVGPDRAGGPIVSHGGFIPGTEALLVRRADDLVWAVLFNTQNDPAGKRLSLEIDGSLHTAADAVKAWPDGKALG